MTAAVPDPTADRLVDRERCLCMHGEPHPAHVFDIADDAPSLLCPGIPAANSDGYWAKVEAGTATYDDHCNVMVDAIKRGDPYAPPFTVEYVEQMRALAKPRKSVGPPVDVIA